MAPPRRREPSLVNARPMVSARGRLSLRECATSFPYGVKTRGLGATEPGVQCSGAGLRGAQRAPGRCAESGRASKSGRLGASSRGNGAEFPGFPRARTLREAGRGGGWRRGGLRATGLVVSEICLPLPDTGACSFSSPVEFQTALETGPAAYLQ